MVCLKSRAKVPLARRAHYRCFVQPEALQYLEVFTASLLFGPGGRLSPHEYRYISKSQLCPLRVWELVKVPSHSTEHDLVAHPGYAEHHALKS